MGKGAQEKSEIGKIFIEKNKRYWFDMIFLPAKKIDCTGKMA